MFYQKMHIDKIKTGNLIMMAIAESEMSYEQIALNLDLNSSRVIYDWINGKKLPSIENLVNLSKMLNKDVKDLIVFYNN